MFSDSIPQNQNSYYSLNITEPVSKNPIGIQVLISIQPLALPLILKWLDYCNSILSGYSLMENYCLTSNWLWIQQLSFLLVLADRITSPLSWLVSTGFLNILQ